MDRKKFLGAVAGAGLGLSGLPDHFDRLGLMRSGGGQSRQSRTRLPRLDSVSADGLTLTARRATADIGRAWPIA